MWSNRRVFQLLEIYRSYAQLWNTTHDEYKNKALKNECWEEIADAMKLPRREVELKIHSLRSQFNRERKKIKMAINMGGNVRQSTWFAYYEMMFLAKEESDSGSGECGHSVLKDTAQDSQSNDSEPENNQTDDVSVVETETQSKEVLAPRNPKIVTNNEDTPIADLERQYKELLESGSPKNSRKRPRDHISRSSTHNHNGKDEFEIYGEYVASEMRHVGNEHAVLMAKYLINNVILDARMGKLDRDITGYNPRNPRTFTEPVSNICQSPNNRLADNAENDLIVLKCEPGE